MGMLRMTDINGESNVWSTAQRLGVNVRLE